MHLHQLVEINENGNIASSVNFGMMDNEEINLALCQGFIFNYDQRKPELSTVGILDALRRSYHSPNQTNIHLIIQDYGKGKSHFAVVVANFFRKDFNSPEVKGILQQVEIATTNKASAIAEGLKLSKQNNKYLVICLSGDRGGDIRKQFLQVLVKNLVEEGIQDSIANHTCSEPLRYLESLKEEDKIKAQNYLHSRGNPDGDLNRLIQSLRENNPAVIPAVKKIAEHITGFTLDFDTNVDIEAILKNLIDNYCTGANARFAGILILFDELNYYLQSWTADQIGAGGTALQNITNICENHKGKIALLSFTQFHPSKAGGISGNSRPEYEKIVSRLAPKDGKTYDNPKSSLELVVKNLIIQKENTPYWREFDPRWNNTLLAEARTSFEKRIKIYREQGWELTEFNRYLGKGCFPLHPLTAYLLCNLNFTQDRTAIQFIKGYVKDFIQTEQVEKNGLLNYIYPIALVDTFIENFSHESVYRYYHSALPLVTGSDNKDELIVLKGLFLFHACGEKLTKLDTEEHEEILASLTGLAKSRIQTALKSLKETRDVINYQPQNKLYKFWEDVNPTSIEVDIEDKIRDRSTSINDVVSRCQSEIKIYLGNDKLAATKFIEDNKLVTHDWQFEYKVYSIDELLKALKTESSLRDLKQRGILAYVLAETPEELQDLRLNINQHLSQSPIKSKIAVAIPQEETGDLARVLLKIKTLEEKDSTEKYLSSAAGRAILKRWQDQVNTQLQRLLKNCTYHCLELENLPLDEQKKPQRVISVLLQNLYPFVPPVDGIDKMRSDHPTGSKIISFVSKQILANTLTETLPDKSYKVVIDPIFVTSWGLLKKISQKYEPQQPTLEKIRVAWDKISEMTQLESQEKTIDLEKIWKTLSNPPFGYSEYNFTILLAAWLAFHRKEVLLRGKAKLSAKLAAVETKSLMDWASTDILDKPTNFVHEWIVKGKSKLIRRQRQEMPTLPVSPIDYDKAQEYLQAAEKFLQSSEESSEVNQVSKDKNKVVVGVNPINNWFKPVEETEGLSNNTSLEMLLRLYPQLLKSPPPPDIRPNVISIQPTQQQQNRQIQALEFVNQQIIAIIEAKSCHVESLSTSIDCTNYKSEIQGIINQPNLPPHFKENLQNVIQSIDVKSREINTQLEERQLQSEDKQIIQEIQRYNSPTKLSTIPLCQEAVNEINNLKQRLHQPEKFTVEVENILQLIQSKVNSFHQNLANIGSSLTNVTQLNQLSAIKTDYDKLDNIFQNSTDYATYQELQQEFEFLKQDLTLIENLEASCQQCDRIEDYNNLLTTLDNQQESLHDFHRFQEKISRLKGILDEKKANAETWLQEVEKECSQMYQLLNDTEKFTIASKIIQRIESQKHQYLNFLNPTLQQSFEYIQRQCVEEQSKDKANQILTLFQQLPRLKRQNLYETLRQYLSDDGEDNNG